MGRRKKKGTFNTINDDMDDISTDEDQDKSTGQDLLPNCPHVGKAVNVNTLKKALKAAWLRVGNCGACAKEKRAWQTQANVKTPKNSIKPAPKAAPNPAPSIKAKNLDLCKDIYMCLKCGIQACASDLKTKMEDGHAYCHYKVFCDFFLERAENASNS